MADLTNLAPPNRSKILHSLHCITHDLSVVLTFPSELMGSLGPMHPIAVSLAVLVDMYRCNNKVAETHFEDTNKKKKSK